MTLYYHDNTLLILYIMEELKREMYVGENGNVCTNLISSPRLYKMHIKTLFRTNVGFMLLG